MLQALNDNKFFLGIMLILLNIGSRHLVDEFSTDPKAYDQNIILRRLAVFAVCFVGTRDLITSILLTAGFIIIAQGVSSRSREGMRNKEEDVTPVVESPAWDESVPPLSKKEVRA
jgi:hypothetical protein